MKLLYVLCAIFLLRLLIFQLVGEGGGGGHTVCMVYLVYIIVVHSYFFVHSLINQYDGTHTSCIFLYKLF